MFQIISNDLFGCSLLKNNLQKQSIIGSFFVAPDGVILNFDSVEMFDVENLNFLKSLVEKYKNSIDLILIGCGNKFYSPSFTVCDFLNGLNINFEWQVTRSAVHTNNLLIEDGVAFLGVFNFNQDLIK